MSISANFPNVRPSLLLDFANSQQLDPRVTFSRSTTAPYYDGKTSVLAEQNLLLYSQDYTNVIWTKNATTVTAAATTAPDGTTTGQTVTPDTSTGTHNISTATIGSATNTTVSGCAKANGYTFINVRCEGTSNFFNISTGALGTIASGSTATITSVGNSWYRFTVTRTVITPTGIAVRVATADNTDSFTGDGTSGIYLWGMQFEQRSSVTAYNATTTSAITNYIPQLLTAPINAPRFDFNPTTGESLGLLIEQSSTNLLTYSSDYTNAVWSKTRSSITSNTIVAPDGTLTGDKLVEDTTNNSHFVFQSTTVSSGAQYTSTIFAKAGERGYLTLFVQSTTAAANTFFNLINGTVVSTSSNATSSITSVGNGWYRCSVTTTTNSTGMVNYWGISADGTNASYTGDGYSGIYIWGAQLEALAFPTSYIPTTSAQVTRASDNASMTGTNFSSWYNNQQGSMYAEFSREGINVNGIGVFSLNPTVGGDFLGVYAIGGNDIIYAITGGVAGSVNTNFGASTLASKKISYALTSGSFRGAYNGTAIPTASPASVEQGVTTLYIGNVTGGSFLCGWIKKLAYYPTVLTQAQLQALTGS